MKRMLTVILLSCFPFLSCCLDVYNQNLTDLKKEINEVFKKSPTDPDKPIYLITVTRSSKNATNGWIVPNPIMKNTKEVKDVLDLVKTEINTACHGGHKIIAFNEMFFSQEEALERKDPHSTDTVTHDSVLEKIKEFNNTIPNSIVFCNFLYKDNRYISWKDALYLYALILFREKNWCFNRDTTILPKKISEYSWDEIGKFNYTSTTSRMPKDIVSQYVYNYLDKDTFSHDVFSKDRDIATITSATASLKTSFLVNRTYCVYGGFDRSFYNKSSYYKESDISIQKGHIYDLGNGYPTLIDLLDFDDVEKIFNTISTEICLDFVCGVRKNNDWKSERGGNSSKLHIIQSNSVEAWCLKRENYPVNVPILYSDADYYFPKLRIAFGGMTHCVGLDGTKPLGILEKQGGITVDKTGILYDKVQKIELPPRISSSNANITDNYTIWIHKI